MHLLPGWNRHAISRHVRPLHAEEFLEWQVTNRIQTSHCGGVYTHMAVNWVWVHGEQLAHMLSVPVPSYNHSCGRALGCLRKDAAGVLSHPHGRMMFTGAVARCCAADLVAWSIPCTPHVGLLEWCQIARQFQATLAAGPTPHLSSKGRVWEAKYPFTQHS